MKFEASKKELVYVKVDPGSVKQINDASFCEREGFGTGLDPQELPAALRFIARHGNIWLQYSVEDGKKIPTGVVEFIPFKNALMFNPKRIKEDLSGSPFKIIIENQERVFQDVRRFAKDKDIVYHHGIAMSRRGQGYGTQLLKYALEQTLKVAIVCYIDGAKLNGESGKLELAPNEDSYTVHLKAGFILAGVADTPVYDEELIYYCFVRPAEKIDFVGCVPLNLAEGNVEEVLEKVRHLTSHGYFGTEHNKETHQMIFKTIKR